MKADADALAWRWMRGGSSYPVSLTAFHYGRVAVRMTWRALDEGFTAFVFVQWQMRGVAVAIALADTRRRHKIHAR